MTLCKRDLIKIKRFLTKPFFTKAFSPSTFPLPIPSPSLSFPPFPSLQLHTPPSVPSHLLFTFHPLNTYPPFPSPSLLFVLINAHYNYFNNQNLTVKVFYTFQKHFCDFHLDKLCQGQLLLHETLM